MTSTSRPPYHAALEVTVVLVALASALIVKPARPLLMAGPLIVWWLLRRDPGGLRASGFERRRLTWSAAGIGVLGGLSLFAGAALILWPAAERLTGSFVDTSELREAVSTRGRLLTMLGVSWVLAGFGEEWMFRAYPTARVRHLPRPVRTAVAAVSIVTFALGHAYQGPAGVLLSGAIGAVLLALYVQTDNNLWINVVAHGTFDTGAFLGLHLGWLG